MSKNESRDKYFMALDLQYFDEHPDKPVSFRVVRRRIPVWLLVVLIFTVLVGALLILGIVLGG
jgi:hypothetical protein